MDVAQLAIDFHRASGLLVGLRLLQLGGEFDLFCFESSDFFFEAMDELLLLFALARAGLPLFGFGSLLILAPGAGTIFEIDVHRRAAQAGGAGGQSFTSGNGRALLEVILVIT